MRKSSHYNYNSMSQVNKWQSVYIAGLMFLFSIPASSQELAFAKHIYLDKSNLIFSGKTRVMLYSSPFSIYPPYNQSGGYIAIPAVQGVDPVSSLVGAIVGAAIINETNKAERDKAVRFNQEIDRVLTGLNINENFQTALQNRFEHDNWLQIREYEPVSHINELAQPGLLVRIEEDSILTLQTKVHFDSQLKSLWVEASAKLWRKNQARPIYFSEISYASPQLAESQKQDLQKKWIEQDGTLLIERIKEGIAEVARLLAMDLELKSDEPLSNEPLKIEAFTTRSSKPIMTEFYPIEDTPNRMIGRLGASDSAVLASMPKSNFTIK